MGIVDDTEPHSIRAQAGVHHIWEPHLSHTPVVFTASPCSKRPHLPFFKAGVLPMARFSNSFPSTLRLTQSSSLLAPRVS